VNELQTSEAQEILDRAIELPDGDRRELAMRLLEGLMRAAIHRELEDALSESEEAEGVTGARNSDIG